MKVSGSHLHTPLYLKLTPDLPWPAHEKTFYLLSRDGVFLCRNHPFFRSTTPMKLGPGELAAVRAILDQVTLREELVAYVVDLVRATRSHESVQIGAGPRATQALLLGSRAKAALAGRDFVTPDDVKSLAGPVLSHRLVLRPEFEIEGLTIEEVLAKILEQVAVPR